ncbi:MAG: peptidoglycan-associated lipoprotein Pal [Verrucomicrobia bacterium]|nr:peptidoglycan-associated lipoprotein Pal [Verrucomicrobiota bacterium]MCF7708978.1 peptidoglycan-associated lipoprotein Pal [Verrucomicrobiota bacterium]
MVGCKRTPKGLTPIPGTKPSVTETEAKPKPPAPSPTENVKPVNTGNDVESADVDTGDGIPLPTAEMFEGMIKDTNTFKANTVYFDFDSSVIKSSEQSKIEEVGQHLKDNPGHKLLIEGHCDERGTEEYNRALGERRALSIREYLANMGIDPQRIRTLSWGEDRPADPAHNEEAWAKNRRGEFSLLLPPENQ